jgi:hypothetical protein
MSCDGFFQKKLIGLLVCWPIFAGAQTDAKTIFFEKKSPLPIVFFEIKTPRNSVFFQKIKWKKEEKFSQKPSESRMVSPQFSPDALPFFCKIEYKMEKKLPVPVRIRLGSAAYVDWLEGKSRELY